MSFRLKEKINLLHGKYVIIEACAQQYSIKTSKSTLYSSSPAPVLESRLMDKFV